MSIKQLLETYNKQFYPWLQQEPANDGMPLMLVIDRANFDLCGTPHENTHAPLQGQRPDRCFHVHITNGRGVGVIFTHAVENGVLQPATVTRNVQNYEAVASAVDSCMRYIQRLPA
jgi:hypothetical protein